jgi:hypothetical protein
MERVEREGVFVETGDLIVVVGSAILGSGQIWSEPEYSPLNTDIVWLLDYYAIIDYIDDSIAEFTFTLEAIRSGETTFAVNLYWACELIRAVKFEIYVNQHPCLCAVCPRECIDCCYDDEDYDLCDYDYV